MTKVHFLGIGGSGASAAAAIAEAQGFEVTGCDLHPFNDFTSVFKKDKLFTGHSPKHLASQATLGSVDFLVVTPAIFSLDPNNPELVAARERKIKIMTWQEFVGRYLIKDKFVIAVCGTHGKTTTTAMIAKILEDAGFDPTVLLGAIIPKWKTNYRISQQKSADRQYFVIEADEFNDNFLAYQPNIVVVTNIEMDHPEYFQDFNAYKNSFKKFLGKTKEKIIANLSDRGIKEVLASQGQILEAKIINYSKPIDLVLQIPGEFNILNASAAYQVGIALKIDPEIIKKSLMSFTGAERRFEKIGEFKGATIYSDFAHHPTEIAKTIEAARGKFPKQRILLVYQPHMFSRTKTLFSEFVRVFQDLPADKIFIMDIFPSREIDTGLVTSRQLVDAINKPTISHIGGVISILEKIKPEIQKGDIVFFMGAGDTDKLAKQLVETGSSITEQTKFKGLKVLILGLGANQGGVGTTKFFAQAGAKVKVTDIKNKIDLESSLRKLEEVAGIEYTLGEHKYEDLDWADLIIKNPAIKPNNPYLLYALNHHKQVEMDMGIFLQFVDSTQIIGITGSKGKSTTATLIYEILKEAGKKVILAGNIGKSVLDTIPLIQKDSIVVLELSSFQLESFAKHKASPHIAVITNIFPDHLNYYGSMVQYIEAKKIIAREQTLSDFLFLKKDDAITNSVDFLKDLEAQIIYFSAADLPNQFSPKLPGQYNLWNMAAALAVTKALDANEDVALKVMQDFIGIEFRLQLIKDINGIKIYNDSAATMPNSTIEAIKSLPNSILICGGMNKNLDYKEMAKAIAESAKMIFFIDGDATDEIKNQFKIQNLKFKIIQGTYSDLEILLEDVKKVAKPGDIILFSPGATSFNFFQNEFDRARKFNQAVEKVFH